MAKKALFALGVIASLLGARTASAQIRLDVSSWRSRQGPSGQVNVSGRVTCKNSPYEGAAPYAAVYLELRSGEAFPGTLLCSAHLTARVDGTFDYACAHGHFGGQWDAHRLYVSSVYDGHSDYRQVLYGANDALQVGLALDWGGAMQEVWSYPTGPGQNLVDNLDAGFLVQASLYDCSSTGCTNPAQAGCFLAGVNQKSPVGWSFSATGGTATIQVVAPMLEFGSCAGTHFKARQTVTFQLWSGQADVRYEILHDSTDAHWISESELPSVYWSDALDPTFWTTSPYRLYQVRTSARGLDVELTGWSQNSYLKPGEEYHWCHIEGSGGTCGDGASDCRSANWCTGPGWVEAPGQCAGRAVKYLAPLTTDQQISGSGLSFDRSWRLSAR